MRQKWIGDCGDRFKKRVFELLRRGEVISDPLAVFPMIRDAGGWEPETVARYSRALGEHIVVIDSTLWTREPSRPFTEQATEHRDIFFDPDTGFSPAGSGMGPEHVGKGEVWLIAKDRPNRLVLIYHHESRVKSGTGASLGTRLVPEIEGDSAKPGPFAGLHAAACGYQSGSTCYVILMVSTNPDRVAAGRHVLLTTMTDENEFVL